MSTITAEQGIYGPATLGSKYSGYRRAVDIAKDVRADLKAAQKSGLIPTDLKIRVRSSHSSVDVYLSGWTSDRVWRFGVDAYGYEGWGYTDEAVAVRRQIEEMREAYNRDASDYMTDYFDVLYYGSTSWEVRPQ